MEYVNSLFIKNRQEELKDNLKCVKNAERVKELIEDDDDYTNITSESVERMAK